MAGSDYGPGYSGSPQPEPAAWRRWLRRLAPPAGPDRTMADYPLENYTVDRPDPSGPLQADDVRRVHFSTTKFREGYDQGEVDDFLDRVETRLRGTAADQPALPLTAQDVIHQRFAPSKLRAGYDQDEVDDLLDRIVTELRRQENEPQL